MDQSELGAVVLTLGTEGSYGPLVRSLLEDSLPPSSIVLVQNPTDPDQRQVEPPEPGIAVVRTERNLGYAGGMNAGIRHHRGRGARLVLVLTEDTRLHPGAVRALAESSRRFPAFGVLGPRVHQRGLHVSYGGRRGRFGGVRLILDEPSQTDDGIFECDWIDGAAMLIRAEVFDDVGLLDDRLFMYFEETEFCLRASLAGWRVGVVRDALAEQTVGESRRPGAAAYLMSRNGLEYARLAAGASGVLAAVHRTAKYSGSLLRSYASPRSTREERTSSRIRLVGTWLGVLDFLRRRWGPPPATVPSLGDMHTRGTRPRP